jgi:hypothetical protein
LHSRRCGGHGSFAIFGSGGMVRDGWVERGLMANSLYGHEDGVAGYNNKSNQDRLTTGQVCSRWGSCGTSGRVSLVKHLRSIMGTKIINEGFGQHQQAGHVSQDGRLFRSGSVRTRSEPIRHNPRPSEPGTGPMVRFFPRHEPWTEPWSGSAGFRFEPRF